MIFLTVGTHEPFDRLVRCVDAWCASRDHAPDILAQITERAEYRPAHLRAVATLTPAEYAECFREAEFVISHAGMGSIITALSMQKPIAVLPRRGHMKETRNDHQFATVQRLKSRPGIFAALDDNEFPEVLDRLLEGGSAAGQAISPVADQRLIDTLRSFIQP